MIKHIFIINPKSGKYNINLTQSIADACKKIYIDSLILEVENIEETESIVNRFKNQDCIIYAVGGDGTLNNILNMMVGGNAKLGIIPTGSGNDFYRSLDRYQSDYINANVMKVNERFGINVFSIGIDAEICKNANLMKKINIPSSLIYGVSILYTLFKHKNMVMGINNSFEKRLLIAMCNASFYGGGFEIAPHVNINKEELKIYTVGDIKGIKLIEFFIRLLNKTHEKHENVDVYYGEHDIHVESLWRLVGQLDGEIMLSNEFHITPHASNIEVVNNRKLIRELTKK